MRVEEAKMLTCGICGANPADAEEAVCDERVCIACLEFGRAFAIWLDEIREKVAA